MARKYKRLVFADRQRIEEMRRQGMSEKEIAAAVGVHIATIYRELDRGTGNGKNAYSAEVAQRAIG
ncbi:helix-turn-helix domain-containing protein [Lachnoclostridium sp. An196]|uniref:helix-turn-helix domain-containing protein n=1 Tax=Lachnoclostridium sp. An196 TaxID=1965583 RepID=UPI000D0FBB2E|nr:MULTISPECIES: helix-turn-helix domain-containing protein [Clostridia]